MFPVGLPSDADFDELAIKLGGLFGNNDRKVSSRWGMIPLGYENLVKVRKTMAANEENKILKALDVLISDMSAAKANGAFPILRVIFTSNSDGKLLHIDRMEPRFMRSYTYKGTVYARNCDVVHVQDDFLANNYKLKDECISYEIPLGWYSYHSSVASGPFGRASNPRVFVHDSPHKDRGNVPRLVMIADHEGYKPTLGARIGSWIF